MAHFRQNLMRIKITSQTPTVPLLADNKDKKSAGITASGCVYYCDDWVIVAAPAAGLGANNQSSWARSCCT